MAGGPLISVRGWAAEDDPRYPAFIAAARAAGVDVVDVFLEPEPFATMRDWSSAVIDELDRLVPVDEPLHLVGYCLGGHVLLEVLGQLPQRGRTPGYVGLVDVWYRPPQQWMDRGIYGRYGVSWSHRIRHQLGRFAPPHAQPIGLVLRSWLRRTMRTTLRLLRQPRPGHHRSQIANWHGQHLAYDWFYPRLPVPVHLYNAEATIADLEGDPTLGLASLLISGSDVVVLPGTDHRTCLTDPPTVADLITMIERDRHAASSTTAS